VEQDIIDDFVEGGARSDGRHVVKVITKDVHWEGKTAHR
jgi:hypothetical protein